MLSGNGAPGSLSRKDTLPGPFSQIGRRGFPFQGVRFRALRCLGEIEREAMRLDQGANDLVRLGSREVDEGRAQLGPIRILAVMGDERLQCWNHGECLDRLGQVGARAVMIGRAYLWGLAANGQAGVENVLDILRTSIDSTMLALGKSSVHDLGPDDLVVPNGFGRVLGEP